jgi:hypothetical protein
LVIPLLGIAFFFVLLSAIAFDLVDGEEKVALVLVLCAYLGGLGIAVIAARRGTGVDFADHQHLQRHPGWFRYGAVGGAGGFIGLVGFIMAALFKAPVFAPVFLVLLVLGAVGAVLLHALRARQVPSSRSTLGLRNDRQP